jgi:hypothetical protein
MAGPLLKDVPDFENMTDMRQSVDMQINKAMLDEAFDNLKGKGKPLPKRDDENNVLDVHTRILQAQGISADLAGPNALY